LVGFFSFREKDFYDSSFQIFESLEAGMPEGWKACRIEALGFPAL
jgi:hypothetical protein